MVVAPNGVDVPEKIPGRELLEKRFAGLKGKKWVVFMSRIHPKKGLLELARAWREVRQSYPGWELVIAGPEQDKGYAEKVRAELKGEAVWTGELGGEEKWAALGNAGFMVLPSYSENFGIVVAESLTVALGKDVAGQFKYADLTKMPHLLIGGSTNSGKSVCLNALIASLVYRATPREVRLLMIDPKRVELSLWDGIPHLMHPVVKDVKQAAGLFRAALKEMERRYDLFAAMGTRNLDGYNGKVPESERLPYIVLIVDELADLMMQQGAEVETSICRLAQLARATGIH